MSAWKQMDAAPLNAALDDYGPLIVLDVNGTERPGRWCAGLELGEIWIPAGWYVDGEPVEPSRWREGKP